MLFVYLVALLATALAVGGLLAVLLATEPEDRLFLKGMGYAFMGGAVINVGPIPLPVPQAIGAVMAGRSKMNSRSRWAAWSIGLAQMIAAILISLLFYARGLAGWDAP